MYTASNNNFRSTTVNALSLLNAAGGIKLSKGCWRWCLWSSIGYQQCLSACPCRSRILHHMKGSPSVLYAIGPNVTYCSFKSGLPLSMSLTHTHSHLFSHKQMCSSLCVASFIQFCKCTSAFTVMLNVAVM